MLPIQVHYQVTLADFRKASYYGLVLRHRKALTIMLIVLGVGILYGIGAAIGLGEANVLVFFLAAAYLIWGILLFSEAERGIRRYLKSPGSLIGCEYAVILEEHRVCIRIPERGVSTSYQLGKLACVFELSSLFLLYTSPQETYLLPKRALTEEQLLAVRQNFRTQLRERFSSRFEKQNRGNR